MHRGKWTRELSQKAETGWADGLTTDQLYFLLRQEVFIITKDCYVSNSSVL